MSVEATRRRVGGRGFPVGVLLPVLLAVAGAAAGQHPSEEQALADWNRLAESMDRLESKLGEVIPTYKAVVIGDDHDRILALLDDVEENDLPTIRTQLEDFADTYGDTAEAINAAMRERVDIDWSSGRHPRQEAGALYEELSGYVTSIPEARRSKAEELLRDAETVQQTIASFPTQVTRENYDKLRSVLETALRYDPGNEQAKQWLERVDDEEKEAFAQIEKAIDDATWPGHDPDFSGPGDPDALARSAMEWLHADEAERGGDDPDRTIAVAVRGDWVSFKRNILGQTVQWGLPIWGAACDSEQRQRGVARVFSLTILTREEPGVEKGPPWTGVAVGDSYLMRLDKIPGGGGSGGRVHGWAGLLWRRRLAFANLLAGLLLLAPALRAGVRPLAVIDDHLGPMAKILGGVVLAVAILTTMLRPLLVGGTIFTDLLPELCGIFAGIALVLDPGEASPAATGPARVALGAAALVVGVAHLIFGWVVVL